MLCKRLLFNACSIAQTNRLTLFSRGFRRQQWLQKLLDCSQNPTTLQILKHSSPYSTPTRSGSPPSSSTSRGRSLRGFLAEFFNHEHTSEHIYCYKPLLELRNHALLLDSDTLDPTEHLRRHSCSCPRRLEEIRTSIQSPACVLKPYHISTMENHPKDLPSGNDPRNACLP